MSERTTGRESDKFMLRLPDGLRDQIKLAAAHNNRSMNAEIIARIEMTLAGFGPYSLLGADSLVKRLEASISYSEDLMFKLLYEVRASGGAANDSDIEISRAVERFCEDSGTNKGHAAQIILRDWLIDHGYLPAPD